MKIQTTSFIKNKEWNLFLLILVCTTIVIFLANLTTLHFPYLRSVLFGFNSLSSFGYLVFLGWISTFCLLVFAAYKFNSKVIRFYLVCQKKINNSKIFIFLLPIFSFIIFYLLRSNFLNSDAEGYFFYFHRDIPIKDAYITHDEIFEFYIHSRFFFFTNKYLGWTLNYSYQVLSCLAGSFFISVLFSFCKHFYRTRSLLLFLLIISGSYIQLFFGDVENYTLTATWTILYLYTGLSFIKNGNSLLWTTTTLAIGITFHLLLGWFLPSLLFLYIIQLLRRDYKGIVLNTVCFLSIIGSILTFFHFYNLPIANIMKSSHVYGYWPYLLASKNGFYEYFVYYLRLSNLIFLLVPGIIFLIPLLVFKKIIWNSANVFLGLTCTFMAIFMLFWHAGLGVEYDWNLFANVGIPFSIFIWLNLLRSKIIKNGIIFVIILMLFFSNTYAWIIRNHFTETKTQIMHMKIEHRKINQSDTEYILYSKSNKTITNIEEIPVRKNEKFFSRINLIKAFLKKNYIKKASLIIDMPHKNIFFIIKRKSEKYPINTNSIKNSISSKSNFFYSLILKFFN